MTRSRARAPDHRINKVRRFAGANPPGTVLPCVVHAVRPREGGAFTGPSFVFYETKVQVVILGFEFQDALIRVKRKDTGERLLVALGWFDLAMTS